MKIHRVRKSNFELLRIIAMCLIIVHHSMVHGALLVPVTTIMSKSNPITFGLFNFIALGGEIGVYLFVLITGYFMLHSKISVKKVVKLWLPIFFWSVVLALFFGGTITHELTIKSMTESLFPILSNQYWFMSTYVFMYLLAPLMNKMLLAIDIKEELLLVFVGLIVTFPGSHLYGKVINSQLIYLCFTYCFGGLIRKHELLSQNWFKILTTILFQLGILTNVLVSFGFSFIGFEFHKQSFIKHASVLVINSGTICLLLAISIFTWLGGKNIGYNKFINNIAATTFGIYLIHDNNFVRNFLWDDLLHMKRLSFQPAYIVFYVLLVCVIIFVICSLLEFIRQSLFSNLENSLASLADSAWKKVANKVSTKFQLSFNR